MEKIKNNPIIKGINSFIAFIENLITNSLIFSLLTKEVTRKNKESFFENILYKIIDFLRFIFNKLRLDKLFDGSIFAKTEIFVGITILLCPFLPTMLDLALVLGTFLSFILKIMLDKDFKFAYSPVNMFLNIFLVIYLISAIVSFDFATSIRIAMLLGSFMLFYYVIINTIKTKKQFKVMIAMFTIAGIFASLLAIYQFVYGGSFANSSFVDKEMFEDIQARVVGPFDNPNVMGEYLLFIIPLQAAYFFSFDGFRKKFLSLVTMGISGVALLLTYSRGCYLGIILAGGIFLLLVSLKFILLFLAGLIALPFVMPKSIINRFTSIGNTDDSSTSYRISIWRGAVELIRDYWYRPVGQGTTAFNSIYPLYALNGVGAQHTHNLFLQIAVETSIFGLVGFFAVLFRVIQNILSGIKNAINKETKYFLIAFVSGLAGFILQSLFDNTWYNNRVFLVFWCFVALSSALKNISINEKQ